MSLSANRFFYTNTNHNDASNVLINFHNLTGNAELNEHPLSKYSKLLFFSPTYNNDLFNAINWANSLGIYKEQHNLVNPLVNNVLINSQSLVSSVIQYRNIVATTLMGSYIDGSNNGDINGHSVSVSEDGLIMAVSARNFSGDNPNSNIGHVRIYEWYNNNWLQKGSDIIGENDNEKIGDSISLNAEGNIIAIGISEYNSGNGGVRIYEFINNIWTKIGELSGHNSSIADHLEVSLSSDGKIVAYGSYMNNSGKGRVDIYKYDNNTWQSIGNISGILTGEIFGAKLTLSADGNVLAASAVMYSDNGNNIGQVRIYKYINNIWEQIGTIDGESNDDYCGTSVSLNIDGTIIAIGAIMNDGNEPDSNRGHVRVYKYLSGSYVGHYWIQMGNDIDGENEGDKFGNCVSLSNDGYILAIGAPSNKAIYSDEQYYSDIGQVQIFQYVQFINKWVKMTDTIYGESQNDEFGKSLALSKNGSVLVISAPYNACEEKPIDSQKGRVTVFNLLGSVEPPPQLQSKVTSFSKIGDDLYGTEDMGNLGGNLAMSPDGLTMVASSINTYNLAPTRNRGSFTVYKWINDNWVQKGSSIGGNSGDYLGHKLAISDDGDTILPSASIHGVKAYKYVNNNWVGSTVYNKNFSYNSRWYHDVDMNSDGTIAVIADFYNYPTHAGSIIVYKWNGSSWSQMGNEIIGDEDNHRFGAQVRLNAAGNILAISGPNYNTVYPNLNSSGVVKIYEYNDTDNQWKQIGGSFYGWKQSQLGYHLELSLDGHTIAMYSYGNYNGAGRIIVYKWNNNTKHWLQHGNIIYGKENGGALGQNMKFNNDATMLVIGSGNSYKFSSSSTSNANGAIHVYQYIHGKYGGQWIYVYGYGGSNSTGSSIAFASDTNKLILYKSNISHPTLKISASLGLGDQNRRAVGLNQTYEIIETEPESEHVTNLSYSCFRIDKIIYTGYDSAVNDRFGTNIAVSKNGKIIAVSAPENDYNESNTYTNNIGSVTMYELINGSWSQLGNPIYGTDTYEKIGEKSLSLSSNGLIVAFGSPDVTFHGHNYYASGSVKTYYYYNNEWLQLGSSIIGPTNKQGASTGSSISLSANGLILSVGSSGLDTNGSLQVYEFKNNDWESMGSSINGTTAGEKCGSSTAFSANGKILAVGSGYFKDESNSSTNIYLGKVRIYKYTNNNWSNIGEIIGLNETPTENYTFDYLGNNPHSISLNYDGTIIATGSDSNGVNGARSGCVRIFQYNESNNNWIQMGTTIRGEIEDRSGRSISLSDDGLTIAIGSYKYRDPLHGYDRGCIRVYKYDNDWKLLSKIDADSFSHIPKLGEKWPNKHVFGKGVALSGDGTIVIGGAPYESNHYNGRDGYVTAYKLVDLKSKNEKFDINKFGSDINGATANDESGYSVSLNAEGTIMAIGSRNHTGSGQTSSGHVRVYKWNETSWNQIGSDIDGTGYGDHSAWSLSLSDDGHIVAIGAPFNNGHVSIYEWNGSIWNKKGDDINGTTNSFFGQSVSLNGNGNIVAIGALNTNNTGSVNIYKFTNNAWVLMEDTIYGETDTEECGYSVSLSSDGHTVAISAPNCNTNADDSGCIYVYKWNGNSWNIMGSKIYGNYFSEKLGWCLSLSGNGLKLAIGARLFNNKGYVYVYEWLNDEWTRIGNELSADLSTATGKYGKYIDFNNDGTILVIGSSGHGYNGINSGGANVYKWINNNWKQIGENIYGDAAGDETGFSVSLNSKGNILSIGSRLVDTTNGTNSGCVRTYEIIL